MIRQDEGLEQEAVVEFCDRKHIPVYHIPNGGKRNAREARKLKRQGVRAGVPDLCIPIPVGKWHGLYIEMKVGRNKTTELQDKWLGLLLRNGYAVAVCYGSEKAIAAIQRYMKGEQP